MHVSFLVKKLISRNFFFFDEINWWVNTEYTVLKKEKFTLPKKYFVKLSDFMKFLPPKREGK